MEWAYRSDVGRVRSHNEDSIAVHELGKQLVVVVADGMGGHKAGDVASRLAAQAVEEELRHISVTHTVNELKEQLIESIEKANSRVLQLSQENESLAGMGTTLVVAVIQEEHVLIANIGDSRAYLVNRDMCKQLTRDHSLVNELLSMGEITESEAKGHPQKNILVRAVGTDPQVKPDVVLETWNEGDYLLLCTDGLTNMVSDELIHSIIKTEQTTDWKADELIRRALEAGGVDNVSLALVKRTVVPTQAGDRGEARGH